MSTSFRGVANIDAQLRIGESTRFRVRTDVRPGMTAKKCERAVGIACIPFVLWPIATQRGTYRCPKSPPACGSTAKPRRPRNSMSRCCRIRGSKRCRRARRRSRRQGRHRAGGGIHPRRPALHGAQRRHAVRIHPRGLVQDRLRRSGRGRSSVGRLDANGGQAERCGWLKDRYGMYWQIMPSVMPQLLGGPIARAPSGRWPR